MPDLLDQRHARRRFDVEATSASRGSSCAARSAVSSTSSSRLCRRGLPARRDRHRGRRRRAEPRVARSRASWSRCATPSPSGSPRRAAPCASAPSSRPATASCSSEMLAAPADYKWLRISRADVGEPGCGHWHSRPRLGPLGMLMGWWRVKVSSGCPLSGRLAAVERETRRRRAPAGALGHRSRLPS